VGPAAGAQHKQRHSPTAGNLSAAPSIDANEMLTVDVSNYALTNPVSHQRLNSRRRACGIQRSCPQNQHQFLTAGKPGFWQLGPGIRLVMPQNTVPICGSRAPGICWLMPPCLWQTRTPLTGLLGRTAQCGLRPPLAGTPDVAAEGQHRDGAAARSGDPPSSRRASE
jgi:hypothetical protein